VNAKRVSQVSFSRQVVMMTCRQINNCLIDYRSGELVPDEQACFEAHLAWCSPCVVYLSSYEAALQLAKEAFAHPEEAVTEDVSDALVQAILATRPRVRR
jgi:anti-sigma factor RsiW